MSQAFEDARRFQRWQRDALGTSRGVERHSIGPFEVGIGTSAGAFTWVTIVDDDVTEQAVRDSVTPLRQLFESHKKELEVEFNDGALPELGKWLEGCGFELEERNPLMACRPSSFQPFAAPDVRLQQLEATTPHEDLDAFQAIRWTEGNLTGGAPPVDRLIGELASPASVYLLAWLDGQRAGTGVSHALNGAGEIVGIVTRPEFRRRGVAATVSSELVSRHLKSGGDFVFLDAANEAAVRVYERLGFQHFGTNLVYRSAT